MPVDNKEEEEDYGNRAPQIFGYIYSKNNKIKCKQPFSIWKRGKEDTRYNSGSTSGRYDPPIDGPLLLSADSLLTGKKHYLFGFKRVTTNGW